MNNLSLVKSERFGEVEADIYSNGNEMFMTINQLAECLGYADKKSVENLIDRNAYVKGMEFSFIQKVPLVLGGTQNTRTFTEDGVYEITMLSGQPKAQAFRAWIRGVLKAIRKNGEYVTPKKAQQRLGEINSAARIIRQTLKEAGMKPQFVAVAMKSLYAPAGVEIPLEGITLNKRLLDATAIAKQLGVLSKSGNPHAQAIGAIIAQVDVKPEEKELAPFQSSASGHAGTNWQYTESVLAKVRLWLERHNYPAEIEYGGKSYKVSYAQIQASA